MALAPDVLSIVERFETDFLNGKNPRLEDFLDLDSNNRQELLFELTNTELELRIRAGEPCRVEWYLERFPEIEVGEALFLELLKTEIQTRRNFDTTLDIKEFQDRFSEGLTLATVESLESSIFQSSDTVDNSEPDSILDLENEANSGQRFRKISLHQQGGLGNVWSGQDNQLQRRIAIKEVKNKFANNANLQARFAKEAWITGQLEHPGVVPVYGHGKLANGDRFYAMRFIEGESLKDFILKKHADQSSHQVSKLSLQRLLRVFIDVCNTVSFAHSRGFIHRDLKPGNVMIGEFGETLVVDWGLAKMVDEPAIASPSIRNPINDEEATLHGQVIGSPAFMSPEQAGAAGQSVGKASDIYSLGATLLATITGEQNPNRLIGRDFLKNEITATSQAAAFDKVLQQQSRAVRPLISICQKAMQVTTSDRYQSVSDLSADIENFLADQPVDAHQESWGEKIARLQRRNRGMVNLAFAGTLLVSLVSLFFVWQLNQANQEITLEKQKSDEAVKKKEEALGRERVALQSERSRNIQLHGTIDLFSKVLTNPFACNLKSDATLTDRVAYLVKVADVDPLVSSFPILRGTLFAFNAKFLKGQRKFEEAIQWYDSGIEAMTDRTREHQGLDDNDRLVIELKIGKCSALLSQSHHLKANRRTLLGPEYEAAKKLIGPLIENLRQDPEAEQETLVQAMTVAIQIKRMEKDFAAAEALVKEAVAIGETIYSRENEHLCHVLEMQATVGIDLKKYGAATEIMIDLRRRIQDSESFQGQKRLNFDLTLGGLALKNKNKVQADRFFASAAEYGKKYFGDDSAELAKTKRQIANLRRRNPL